MSQLPQDPLLDHEYDGIREYDNPCPTWWHLIFLGSVVFSVFYFVFFHIAPHVGTNGWTVEESYESTVAASQQAQFAEIGELAVDEANILKYMGDQDWLAFGAAVYKTHCKSCHADNGSRAGRA
jgi:cytochrome c oxidase cbb3-type subunit 3